MKPQRLVLSCAVVLVIYFTCAYYYLREEPVVGTGLTAFFANHRTVLKPPETFDPIADCSTPFGQRLGIANHTPAFSNCHSTYRSKQPGFFSFADPMDVSEPLDANRQDKTLTATRWIAIEFVMRWCQFNKGVMMMFLEDVQSLWGKNYYYNAAKVKQMWDAEYIINYNAAPTPDDIAFTRPRPGDIILYNADVEKGFSQGHAAVVVAVRNDIEGAGGVEKYKELAKKGTVPRVLYLAEQNYDNKPWVGGWYSRVAYFKWQEPTRAGMPPEGYIEDDSGLSVLGRMRVGNARVPEEEMQDYARRIVDDEEDEEYDL